MHRKVKYAFSERSWASGAWLTKEYSTNRKTGDSNVLEIIGMKKSRQLEIKATIAGLEVSLQQIYDFDDKKKSKECLNHVQSLS